MRQEFNLARAEFLNREIRNVHWIKPINPNVTSMQKYKPYRCFDVDVTPEHEEMEKYLDETAKSMDMIPNYRSPIFKRDGKWWIRLKNKKEWSIEKLKIEKNILAYDLGTDDIDGKILIGNVNANLMNWEFGQRQGFTFYMTNHKFVKIVADELRNSAEPREIKF